MVTRTCRTPGRINRTSRLWASITSNTRWFRIAALGRTPTPRGRARSSTHPLLPKTEPSHAGPLAATYGVLDVAPSSVTVESVKKAEDTNEYIVRLYETADKASTAVLNFTRTPRQARETDMMEWDKFVPSKSFAIKGTRVDCAGQAL